MSGAQNALLTLAYEAQRRNIHGVQTEGSISTVWGHKEGHYYCVGSQRGTANVWRYKEKALL